MMIKKSITTGNTNNDTTDFGKFDTSDIIEICLRDKKISIATIQITAKTVNICLYIGWFNVNETMSM